MVKKKINPKEVKRTENRDIDLVNPIKSTN